MCLLLLLCLRLPLTVVAVAVTVVAVVVAAFLLLYPAAELGNELHHAVAVVALESVQWSVRVCKEDSVSVGVSKGVWEKVCVRMRRGY